MIRASISLVALAISFAATDAAAGNKTRVYIDPGHGFPGNEGAETMRCEREQDVVLEIAVDLGRRLEASGEFTVQLARTSSAGPTYDRRIAAAEKFRADVLLSIHLDARGSAMLVDGCPRNDDQPGFGVLFSDKGAPKMVGKRRALSRALAEELSAGGFLAYDGYDYGGLYDFDTTPGVFIDRRGLFMLRRPVIPSVIIETHHGLSRVEREHWDKEGTRAKFAESVARALSRAVRDRSPGRI